MRIIPLFLLATLSPNIQAQLWEVADQRNELIHFENALPVGGDRWAVIGSTSFAGSHLISVRNGDGSIAWENIDEYFTSREDGEVVLMPDSGLLHVGVADHCDYYGPDSRMRRYAPDGAVLWERMISTVMSYPPTMAAKGSISHVAVASSDSVYVMDLDGNVIGGYQAAFPDIKRILWASDSTLFIVRSTDVHLVDINGTVMGTTPIGSTVVDMHRDGQDLFVLANDSVRRFDTSLSPLGIVALPDLDPNSNFVVSENGLFVHTAMGLYQLAADGTPTFLFPWPALPNLSSTGCAIRNSTVLSIGNTNISGRSTGIIRTLAMNGEAPQHDQDVEVLLHVDSVWTEFVGGYYPWDRWADITGLVVNHGSDTLRSVVLSMWLQVPWILCDMFSNRIDTAGFALAPGDTLSLPFGVVGVRLGLQAAQAAGAGEICIVALAPDHLADRAPQDNTACVSVDFVLGVEESLRNSPISLAPNPVVNSCMVSGLAALGAPVHLTIMDLTGRIVAEHFSAASTNNMQFDVSELPAATYILSAKGASSREVIKLMVARP
ncbi:MAG: T9SS type A sorting domain-containing protein [Flavobacteriales bacterium]